MDEAGEAHPVQTLQDQIRCAVPASHARADQSNARDVEEVVGRFPLRPLRLDQRDAKHPVLTQGMREYFLVARLKNIERQQGVRKKKRTGKRHDRDRIW